MVVFHGVYGKDPIDRPASMHKAKEILTNNGYPQHFIDSIMKERVDCFYNGKPKNAEKPKIKPISVPYIPGLSERIYKTLRNHIRVQDQQQHWNNLHKNQIHDPER